MNPNASHTVYRCFDAADRLLYVGCTVDVAARMQVHASSWQNPASAVLNLRMARMTEIVFPDKATARDAERAAIREEAPLLNLHHQRVSIKPAERYALMDAYLESTRPTTDAGWAELMSGWAS